MLFVNPRNGRFIKITGDVGTRIPKGCGLQAFGRVFFGILRFISVVLIVSFTSRPLVYISYAVEPITFTIENTANVQQVTAGTYNVYKNISISHEDVLKYFGSGENLTFTIKSCNLKSWTNNGATSVSISDVVPQYFLVRAIPASGGSTLSTRCNFGDEVTISYGGGGIYITAYPQIGTYTISSGANWRGVVINTLWDFEVPVSPLSDNEALNEIVDQNNRFHQEELDKGESSGSDAAQMVTDLQDQVKSKWEILFYPIEFTQKFLALFSSSAEGATAIEFPAFSLEVDGASYQVWDSYTYDLSTLKSDFGILFTGLHMVIGVIEVGWFIKYLYRKYDEVFGSGGDQS